MELSIRISSEDFKKLDISKAMDGHYIPINAEILLMSMYMNDGAIEECEAKAEDWDNLPDEIIEEYKRESK